ncbi:MAG: hypothetical protein JKY67_16475 [Pseudomonadales bacterium]|nr:hypothetical protein [Pseudomonadales bacterium]
MANLLKVDEGFIPCPAVENDELFRNGFFEFNITKIIDYIGENGLVPHEISISDFPREFSRINESHMDSVELGEPVILLEIAPGRYNLVDGNHRMERARREGITKIMTYRLSAEEHVKFLTRKDAYLSYVEYWNEKLE